MPPRNADSEKNAILQRLRWRERDAREVLDLWRRSGTTLTEFARAHDLDRNRLARWRDRLGKGTVVTGFHPVRLVDRLDRSPTSSLRGIDGGTIEILVSGNRRVAVRPGFDTALLAEIVRVLETLPC